MSNLNGGLSGSGLLRGALGGGGAPIPTDVYWDDILDKPDFATVATSGSYNDLTDKPTIPAAQVNADWNATSGVAEILNKPTLATVATSGSYNDLTDTPTIPAAQVNADWNATSGVAEILNKPTIPAAQVNADWNATSGVAEILNKPTIPTTASQISYDNTTSGLTATDTQEAIDENAAEITTIKSNLTDLRFGTPVRITVAQDGTYSCSSYGVITGYWRHSNTTSTGSFSITSSVLSGQVTTTRYFSQTNVAGEYHQVNLTVVKGETLTFNLVINVDSTALYFIPFVTPTI